jgi:hypothetical protein
MKTFTTTDTSGHDLVHMVGSKDDYTITENSGSISYESVSWDRKYVVTGNEELNFKRPDSQGKTKFKWNDEFAPFEVPAEIKIFELTNISINTGSFVSINLTQEAKDYLADIESYSGIRIVTDLTQTSNTCGYPHSTQMAGLLYNGSGVGVFGGNTGDDDVDRDVTWNLADLSVETVNYIKSSSSVLFNKHFWSDGASNRSGCKAGTIHTYQIWLVNN